MLGETVLKNHSDFDQGLSLIQTPGISRDQFAGFHKKYPGEPGGFVEYLRAFPEEQPSFDDLMENCSIIKDLFSHDEYWQREGNVRYLSFKDVFNLFEPIERRKKEVNWNSNLYGVLKRYFYAWNDQNAVKYQPRTFAGYSLNNYYPEEGVKEFLLFTLDLMVRKKFVQHRQNKSIIFSREQNFVSLTKRAKRAIKSWDSTLPQATIEELIESIPIVKDLFDHDDYWTPYLDKKYLKLFDIRKLFTFSREDLAKGDAKKILYRVIKNHVQTWRMKNNGKFKAVHIPGDNKNNYYEKEAVCDLLLYSLKLLTGRIERRGPEKNLAFSSELQFHPDAQTTGERVIFRRAPVKVKDKKNEAVRLEFTRKIPEWTKEQLQEIWDSQSELIQKARDPDYFGHKLNIISNFAKFESILIRFKYSYFIQSRSGLVTPIKNLTDAFIWNINGKPHLSPDEQNEMLAQVLNPLWEAVFGYSLNMIDIESRPGKFIYIGDFINLVWIYLEASKLEGLNFGVAFANKENAVPEQVKGAPTRLTEEMKTVLRRARLLQNFG